MFVPPTGQYPRKNDGNNLVIGNQTWQLRIAIHIRFLGIFFLQMADFRLPSLIPQAGPMVTG